MTAIEQLTRDFAELPEHDRRQVTDLVRLLRLRVRLRTLDASGGQSLAAAYAEFDEEDAALAEAGMSDYSELVRGEDQ